MDEHGRKHYTGFFTYSGSCILLVKYYTRARNFESFRKTPKRAIWSACLGTSALSCMEQSHLISWHSTDQNILCHLWFPMLNTTTSLRSRQWLTGSCLIYINPVHTLRSHLSKIHFNITFPSIPESPKWYLPLRYIKILRMHFSTFLCHICPSHLTWFGYSNF
jgi:hypothetical protein